MICWRLRPWDHFWNCRAFPFWICLGASTWNPIAWPGNDVLRCAQHRALDAQFQIPRARGEPEPNELRAV